MTTVPIIRWSDGWYLRRTPSNAGDAWVAFSLHQPVRAKYMTHRCVLVVDALVGSDGWPLMPFSGAEVTALEKSKYTISRSCHLYDAMVALRLLGRLSVRNFGGYDAWDLGPFPIYPWDLQDVTEEVPTWEWTDERLVDEVANLLDLPPPALLLWPDLLALVGS